MSVSAKGSLLYRLLLLLLPPRFRREFGADLEPMRTARCVDSVGPAG